MTTTIEFTMLIRPQPTILVTMGIKCGHAATYSLNGLSLNLVYTIAKQRSRAYHEDTEPPQCPTIDIDASWVVRSKTSISPSNKIGYLMRIVVCFAKAGFNVVVVCDSDSRHHSKRSTTIRVANSYRNRIMFLKNQNRILYLFSNIRLAGRLHTEEEKEELQQLSKETKSLEKKLASVIYDTEQSVGTGTISVIQAEQQADSCIAARANRFVSHMILTADSDQAVLLGSKCVSIKNYHFNNNDGTIKKLDLFSSSYKTIRDIAVSISLPLSPENYVAAKFELFNDIDDYKVRALLAIGLGCDVYPSGVKNVGPKILHDFILKLKTDDMHISSFYYHLLKLYSKLNFKNNRNTYSDAIEESKQIEQELAFERMINIFVESYLYEPSNYYNTLEKVPQTESTYIHDPPSSLHYYNRAFVRNSQFDCCVYGEIDDADCCVGPGNGEHFFLLSEGQHFCISCSRSICNSCLFQKPNSERICCNECFLSESNIVKTDLEGLPTEEEMRIVCATHGCQANITDDISDLINLYQNIILNKKLLDPEKYGSMIPMPSEKTTYLNQLDVIVEFSLTNGGSFVNNENLPFENLIDALDLLKELVEVYQGDENSISLTSNAVTPKMVQFFAEQSRIHFGWRLLERGMRHSIDLLTTDVSQTFVKIFKYKDDTGIYLKMKVRSSMKKEWYNTEVAFTVNTIVACKCSCKCGSNNMERIVCIHVLPTLELIGFFLKEALAEHILVETSYYVKKTDLTVVDALLLTKFRMILEVFLITCQPDNLEQALRASSFRDMLSAYDVGTDNRKFCLPPPRDPKDLGPIKELNFKSIRTIAKNIRTGNVSKMQKKKFHTKVREAMTREQYIKTMEACITFCALNGDSSTDFLQQNMVGYMLLEKRTENLVDFKKVKLYKSCSIIMKQAINEANSEFRIVKRRTNQIKLNQNISYTCYNENEFSDDENDTLQCYDDDDYDSNVVCEDDDYNKENIPPAQHVEGLELSNNNNKNSVSITKRKSCCASGCCTTTSNKPQATWIYVPNPRCKKIVSGSTDKQRKQFASSKHHREQYLLRLGLEKTDKRTTLVHCNDHELIREEIEFKYKNKQNNDVQFTASMVLPKDPTKAYPNTRTSLENYQPIVRPNKRAKCTNQIKNNASEKKKYRNKKCDFVGCYNKHTGDVGFKWKRIPKLSNFNPLILKERNNKQLYHTVNMVYRKVVRKQCGICENDTRANLRICNKHKMEMKVVDVSWTPLNRISNEIVQVNMYIPKKITREESQPTTEEKNERIIRCNQREIRSSLNDTVLRTSMDAYQNASSRSSQNTLGLILVAIEQLSETIIPEQTFIEIYDNTPFHFNYILKDKYKKENVVNKRTIFRMENCNDKFIKQHTGFKSLSCMMCFILVVCKGETEVMINTTTSLTYFEEWLLYFTIVWGRTCTRWFLVAERFGVGESTARSIFDSKQQMLLDIREDWPKYTNYDEDVALQREGKWLDFFDNNRVVMWDMTDISIHQPSSAESSRLTYSSYYAGTCAKGGIFLQSSSWIGTHDLWMGGVSDSEYLTRSGILNTQMMFVRDDLVFQDIPFTNITDKGFRVTADCFRAGGQRVLQPPFMKSDKRFTTEQTVEAAAIATIRSANERAVNRIKECEYCKKGLREAENVERLSAVFLTFGYQANFMFYPVQ